MNAVILLAPNLGDFYFSKAPLELARATFEAGEYRTAAFVSTELEGEDCAEEMFDLTNNPSRQDERMEKYGKHRSVSIGDIIVKGNDFMVCMSCGWEKL